MLTARRSSISRQARICRRAFGVSLPELLSRGRGIEGLTDTIPRITSADRYEIYVRQLVPVSNPHVMRSSCWLLRSGSRFCHRPKPNTRYPRGGLPARWCVPPDYLGCKCAPSSAASVRASAASVAAGRLAGVENHPWPRATRSQRSGWKALGAPPSAPFGYTLRKATMNPPRSRARACGLVSDNAAGAASAGRASLYRQSCTAWSGPRGDLQQA